MKKCDRCGALTEADDHFCGDCGYNLESPAESMAVTQQELKATDVKFNLGMVYLKMGKYGEAVDIFDGILKTDPENRKVMEMRESAQDQRRQTEEVS